MKMGFIGTGIMGEPMALSLVNANTPFIAWNRATAKLKQLREAGAETADTIDMVSNKADIVILMLVDGAAIDEVIGRQTCEFADRVKNHTIVHMGTTSADYSKGLEEDILAAGGQYVEAPVSGSHKPAEEGSLVAMLAGKDEQLSEIKPLMAPMCRSIVEMSGSLCQIKYILPLFKLLGSNKVTFSIKAASSATSLIKKEIPALRRLSKSGSLLDFPESRTRIYNL